MFKHLNISKPEARINYGCMPCAQTCENVCTRLPCLRIDSSTAGWNSNLNWDQFTFRTLDSKREPIGKSYSFILYKMQRDYCRDNVEYRTGQNTICIVIYRSRMTRTYSFCALVNAFRYRALMMTNATMNNNSSLYSTWYRLPRHRNNSLVNPALLDDDTLDW